MGWCGPASCCDLGSARNLTVVGGAVSHSPWNSVLSTAEW